jgi:hypothetical protein
MDNQAAAEATTATAAAADAAVATAATASAATAATTEATAATAATAARTAAAAAALDDQYLHVALAAREIQPASTKKSYQPVKIEFKALCNYKYEEDEDEPAAEHELITNKEKIFSFLYYVAFRKKRDSHQAWTFDPDDYEDTIQRHLVAQGTQDELLRDPVNDYIGYSSFKIVRAALRELLTEQRSEHHGTEVYKGCSCQAVSKTAWKSLH